MTAPPVSIGRGDRAGVARLARAWSRVYGDRPWLRAGADVVNSNDRDRLYGAFPFAPSLPPHLGALLEFLGAATPLLPERVPPDLVTMNSIARLHDPASGDSLDAELVYPFDADRMPHARSVAAPFGAALFGRRIGDRVTWSTPRGEHAVVIEALVYQPEREGHLDR